MLNGIDASHHNPYSLIIKGIMQDKAEFCILKATEGKTYKDPKLANRARDIANYVKVMGYYHYARPENGNTPEEEAANFWNVVKDYIADEGALLALDWEQEAEKCDHAWIEKFGEAMKQYVNGEIMVYCNASAFKKAKPYMDNKGLWLAHWGKDYSANPYIDGYLIAIHQNEVRDNLDRNVFHGKMTALKKYLCSPKEEAVESEKGCECCEECNNCVR